MQDQDRRLPSRVVRERYSVTDMTLYRWERDEKLGFPTPIKLNGRKYWLESELIAWERARAAKSRVGA